jgi:hypothetical protein
LPDYMNATAKLFTISYSSTPFRIEVLATVGCVFIATCGFVIAVFFRARLNIKHETLIHWICMVVVLVLALIYVAGGSWFMATSAAPFFTQPGYSQFDCYETSLNDELDIAAGRGVGYFIVFMWLCILTLMFCFMVVIWTICHPIKQYCLTDSSPAL